MRVVKRSASDDRDSASGNGAGAEHNSHHAADTFSAGRRYNRDGQRDDRVCMDRDSAHADRDSHHGADTFSAGRRYDRDGQSGQHRADRQSDHWDQWQQVNRRGSGSRSGSSSSFYNRQGGWGGT